MTRLVLLLILFFSPTLSFAHDDHETETETPNDSIDTSICPESLSVVVLRLDQDNNSVPNGETVILDSLVTPLGEGYEDAVADHWPEVTVEWSCDDCAMTGENEFGYPLVSYQKDGTAILGQSSTLYLSRPQKKWEFPELNTEFKRPGRPNTKHRQLKKEIGKLIDYSVLSKSLFSEIDVMVRVTWDCAASFDPYVYGSYELSLGNLFRLNVIDADGDGYESSEDCDDANDEVHPGEIDVPDDIDQDCDGIADETISEDNSSDTALEEDDCVEHEHDGSEGSEHTHDCPESVAEDGHDHVHDEVVSEVIAEICDDQLDNDQDSFSDCLDADCFSLCHDQDEDGFTRADGDCDDTNPLIYSGANEICDDADNDCDLSVDEGLSCATSGQVQSLSDQPVAGCALTIQAHRHDFSGLFSFLMTLGFILFYRIQDSELVCPAKNKIN